MASKSKHPLYDQSGQVIGHVRQSVNKHGDDLIAECHRRHMYIVAAEVLFRGELNECPVCPRGEEKESA